jgi:hypothetical protein
VSVPKGEVSVRKGEVSVRKREVSVPKGEVSVLKREMSVPKRDTWKLKSTEAFPGCYRFVETRQPGFLSGLWSGIKVQMRAGNRWQ